MIPRDLEKVLSLIFWFILVIIVLTKTYESKFNIPRRFPNTVGSIAEVYFQQSS